MTGPAGRTPVADLVRRLEGRDVVRYRGRRWAVTTRAYAGGRSLKLWAEELGGTDVVSANVYLGPGLGDAGRGEAFRPCEMPAERVLDFLRGWEPAG
ncbi:peptide methionine sulfoxide reductase [Nocardioides zeae]|uniref:Peptide methionine sulfoxide reductase n=1 Tax=Nocardioides imazamoxiresistens TaxID=3231893 RepID=A0ABU3PVX7_9ACTN|nr:peptide methionine sulfoxide reductase [Nocardioides zeae]MDT9593383.1 peptide methionine sulfoxide reductase [Nocardioides zeae]